MIQSDGSVTRPYKWEVLGTINDYPTRKLALRALEARLSTINSPTYRARPTAAFAESQTAGTQRFCLNINLVPKARRAANYEDGCCRVSNCALKDLEGQRLLAFISGL